MKIIKGKEDTYYLKNKGISKGCQYCLKGAKTVLFINGLCQNPHHCYWYCPISKERKGKKNTYANEIIITKKEELIEEINITNAKGMSITGGDPLFDTNLEETLSYIKFIKNEKGKRFHIHLYTNGLNFNENIAYKLREAGLDEIRFNPPKEKWSVIKLALKKGYKVGAEVPLIPSREYLESIEKFIYYLDEIGADFINLNEFEMCVSNCDKLKERGFKLKSGTIASVENSREYAIQLLNKIAGKIKLKVHFCTVIAKDYWQLGKRYIRRAKSIKKPFEQISKEGLILYAQIENNNKNLIEIYEKVIEMIKNPQKNIHFENNLIKLPIKYIVRKDFIQFINLHNLKAFIVEKTPFIDDKYYQITEKIPLKVYMGDRGLIYD
jgi:pyruvate formate-lyase activating enzyme-like uncharacterized protein